VRELLRRLDARAEAVGGAAQLELRVDVELARHVDGGEEHVAELLRAPLGRAEVVTQLAQLVVEIRKRALRVRILEAGGLRALLNLARVQRPREILRDVVEDPCASLLVALDPLPVLAHPAGRVRFGVAEDVRMPTHELLVDRTRDGGEIARAPLLEQQCEEVDLEEQVAELVEQLLVVAGERGVGDLVGLLDRVGDDRLRRLLAVPRAVAPQTLRQALQLEKIRFEAQPAVVVAAVVVPVVVVASGA
jgi:hypothetical protein